MIVVYLANRYIRVVDGESSGERINVRGLYYTMDTQGCILNGTVTDQDGFVALISELWERYHLPKKGVYLVIDSTQFTTKVVHAPIQKPKQMMEYVSREFTDVGRISNPVCGYFPLNGKVTKKAGIQNVFAMMTSKDYIQEYRELFGKLGIVIDGVECAMGAMHRLVGSLTQVKEADCIVQFVEDMTLINVLMVNGTYVYSSRNRLFSEQGTPAFAVEIARTVSNILQFAKAQNIQQQISKVHIAGLGLEDFAVYADSIRQINPDLQSEKLNAGDEVSVAEKVDETQNASHFALAIGGLLKTDSKTNLIQQVLRDPKKEQAKSKRKKTLIPIVIMAAVVLLIGGVLGGRALFLSSKIKEMQEYNNRADVVAACEEYDAVSEELRSMGMLSGSLSGLKEAVLSYPKIDNTTEQVVASCAAGLVSAEISSYDSANGMISFSTSAANVEQINKFIELLSQQEIFAYVDYTGYTQDAEGQWNVKVNCLMAGRQEETDDVEAN